MQPSEPRSDYLSCRLPDGEAEYRLHFLDWGDAAAQRTAVCVHGLSRNARDFDYLARRFCEHGYRVLALDMPGRGGSDCLGNPAHYQYATYISACLHFLNHFHLRQVHWIGTSMGGIIGMMIAAHQPDRIKRLVLNDVGSIVSAEGLQQIRTYLGSAPHRFDSREEAKAILRQNLSSFGITDEAHWLHVFTHSLQDDEQGVRFAYDRSIIEAFVRDLEQLPEGSNIDLSEIWAKIIQPVLVVRGELSTLLSTETVLRMMQTNPYCHATIIPAVGHAPMLMRQDEIAPILEWLTQPPTKNAKNRATAG